MRPAALGAVVPHAYLRRFLAGSHAVVLPISEKIKATQTQVGHDETFLKTLGGLRDIAGGFFHGIELY